MGKTDKERARLRRIRLTLLLGAHCTKCHTPSDLEFDCIKPCGDEHHKMDTSARMCFYYRQFKKKNLQLLCGKCHNKKTNHENKKREDIEPF